MSEFAQTFRENLPFLENFRDTVICGPILDGFQELITPVFSALGRLNRKERDRSDVTPQDVHEVLKVLMEESDTLDNLLNDAYEASSALFTLTIQLWAARSLMRNLNDYADKVEIVDQSHLDFAEFRDEEAVQQLLISRVIPKKTHRPRHSSVSNLPEASAPPSRRHSHRPSSSYTSSSRRVTTHARRSRSPSPVHRARRSSTHGSSRSRVMTSMSPLARPSLSSHRPRYHSSKRASSSLSKSGSSSRSSSLSPVPSPIVRHNKKASGVVQSPSCSSRRSAKSSKSGGIVRGKAAATSKSSAHHVSPKPWSGQRVAISPSFQRPSGSRMKRASISPVISNASESASSETIVKRFSKKGKAPSSFRVRFDESPEQERSSGSCPASPVVARRSGKADDFPKLSEAKGLVEEAMDTEVRKKKAAKKQKIKAKEAGQQSMETEVQSKKSKKQEATAKQALKQWMEEDQRKKKARKESAQEEEAAVGDSLQCLVEESAEVAKPAKKKKKSKQ